MTLKSLTLDDLEGS